MTQAIPKLRKSLPSRMFLRSDVTKLLILPIRFSVSPPLFFSGCASRFSGVAFPFPLIVACVDSEVVLEDPTAVEALSFSFLAACSPSKVSSSLSSVLATEVAFDTGWLGVEAVPSPEASALRRIRRLCSKTNSVMTTSRRTRITVT